MLQYVNSATARVTHQQPRQSTNKALGGNRLQVPTHPHTSLQQAHTTESMVYTAHPLQSRVGPTTQPIPICHSSGLSLNNT